MILHKGSVVLSQFSSKELSKFAWGMANLIESGVHVISALEVYCEACTNRKFSNCLVEIRQKVLKGMSLCVAMEGNGFPDQYIQLIAVGESCGDLETVFWFLAKEYEVKDDWKEYYGKALILPSFFLLGMTLIWSLVHNTFVITPYLFGLGFLLFSVLFVSVLENGKEFTKNGKLATLCRVLIIPLNGGLVLCDVFSLGERYSKHTSYERCFQSIIDDIIKGESIYNAMLKFKNLFPVDFLTLIFVAEQTGRLTKALEENAKACEKEMAVQKEGFLNCLRILFLIFWLFWSVFVLLPIF